LPGGVSFAMFRNGALSPGVRLELGSDPSALVVGGGDWQLNLSGQTGLSANAAGALSAASGTQLSISSTGYDPNTKVKLFLISADTFVTSSALKVAASSSGAASAHLKELGVMAAEPLLVGEVEVADDGSWRFAGPLQAQAGDYIFQINGFGVGGATRSLSFKTTIEAAGLRGWTRDFGNNQLKLYARGVIGAGKVSFFQNGREIAWVRAVDATDPKLNVGTPGARDGMVRTATPVMGRNVFEIYVDGERVVRRIFTRR